MSAPQDPLRRELVRAVLLAIWGIVVVLVAVLGLTLARDADGVRNVAPVAPSALPSVNEDVETPTARSVRRGALLAAISIPRLDVWSYPVIEGTDPEHLDRGVGHFSGTALPGEYGNSAYAGHRWDGPLYDFERLRIGDKITVAQDGAHWVYEVTTSVRRVLPEDVWIIAPVEGRKRSPVLTLITCWPKDGNSHREYVRARLTGRIPA